METVGVLLVNTSRSVVQPDRASDTAASSVHHIGGFRAMGTLQFGTCSMPRKTVKMIKNKKENYYSFPIELSCRYCDTSSHPVERCIQLLAEKPAMCSLSVFDYIQQE